MDFVKDLKNLSKYNTAIIGGKGASLGKMIKASFPIPPGFVILADAFERFLAEIDINVEIEAMWDRINIKNIKSVEENSKIIRNLILKEKIPKDISKEILETFSKLKTKYVAVRSSATAEDSKIDSWAGELETYLNTTKLTLLENIKKCWASLYTPRALFYRIERNLHRKQISVAVVVQKMIQSEVSGICFTVHPVTKAKNQIVVEVGWGLGEIIVGGKITPDTYIIDKENWSITDINISEQKLMIVGNNKGTKEIKVPKLKREKQKLNNKQIIELAKVCKKIEDHYKLPQDIEWAVENNRIYITQSRPITTLS